ncbi:lasso RiPP family leader peptide-containing protein [Reyranella sp.]|jgi:hypothetical protein|uniref:lasso RiPP family leader peptide-containing protein n=1 Tax=Reyranella sp. TaxID=1929291 RepID=UPI002F92A139
MSSDESSSREPSAEAKPSPVSNEKKPYSPPVLTDWGSLGELTQKVGFFGKTDGGHLPFNRTR